MAERSDSTRWPDETQRPEWRRRTFLGATAFGFLGLGACGGNQPAAESVQIQVSADVVAQAEPYKGSRVGFLQSKLYSSRANEAVERSAQAFAAATGTTVETNLLNTDSGDLVARTDAAIKAGEGQDMGFVPDSRFVAQFHDLGDLVDVTDVVTELTALLGEPSGVSKYNCTFDGRWFGIPYQFIGNGSFARRDWFEEKGIPLQDSYPWVEMRDIALEISDPTKRRFGWGITVNRSSDGNGFIENVINSYGGSMTSNDGRTVTLNSPETIEAVSFIGDIYTNPRYKPMLPAGIESWTDPSNNENWLAGVLGFTRNGYTVYADAKATGNPVHELTHAFRGCSGPAIDRPISVSEGQALIIFKGAKNPELAKVLAKYLVSGSALLNVAKEATGMALPAWEKVWESDPFYTSGDPAFRALREDAQQPLPVRTTNGYEFPKAPSSGRQAALQAYILTDMVHKVIQGTSAKDAVTWAHQQIVQIFNQQGLRQ